jgi:hypothetical protein
LDYHSLEIGLSQSNFLDRVSQIFLNEGVLKIDCGIPSFFSVCYFSAKTSLKFVSTKNKVCVSFCPVFHTAPFTPTHLIKIWVYANQSVFQKFRTIYNNQSVNSCISNSQMVFRVQFVKHYGFNPCVA